MCVISAIRINVWNRVVRPQGHVDGLQGNMIELMPYETVERRPPSNAGGNTPYLDSEAAALAQLPQAGFHTSIRIAVISISFVWSLS